MEAFSTQGNGTMTIVKEKSPTSFEVEQNLKTWPSNGARTIAFDSKTGHLFAMAAEAAPPPPPPRGHAADRSGRGGATIPGSFTIIMIGISKAGRPWRGATDGPTSATVKQRHEPEVHVHLLVAVKERQAGGVRREVDLHDR